MSKYYSPIDISKYQYDLPEDIREFMDRPLNPQELKEFIPGYSDIKDIASKSLDVVKAATDIRGKRDKDQEKKDKERKKDYKQYSKFLVNGFRDYEQQYFLHPILYVNEEKRLIGYTVLSDTTNSWLTDEFITLQPYKLQNTDLYKLDKQKNHGKLQTIAQKVLGFPYKRCLFKKIEVDNISNSSSPVSGFKMGQQLTLPIYKALNKFNPVRGTKFYCDLVYYDESNRQLLIGKEIYIEQVTQNIITLSKIVKAKKEKEKDKIIQRKIDLSLIIPAYAKELKLENPTESEPVRENSLFSYTPIFPQSIEDGEEFYRSFKEKEEKGEKPKLVLFYIRPFLAIKEFETERDSFSIDKSTFDFSYPEKYDSSSLRPFLLGKEDRYSYGGLDTRRSSDISKEELEKFLIKHRDRIRLHGFDLRYLSESVSQSNKLKEASLKDIIAKVPQYLFSKEYCPYQYEVSFKEPSGNNYIFTVISKISAPEGTKPITEIVVPFNTILQFVSNKKIEGKSYNLLIINEQVIERQAQGDDDSEGSEEVNDTVTAEEETPSVPPADETTISASMEEILFQDEITSDTSPEEIETTIEETEDPRARKNLEMFAQISQMVTNNSEIDIIELDETQIGDPSQFASRIESSQSIQDLASFVKNKYKGKILGYNPTSENDPYFVVDNIEKVEFTPPSPSPTEESQAQSSPQQNTNTPDISKAEGEVKYFKMMDEDNLNNSESVESDSKTAFFEGWKQGNNYYVRVNLKVRINTLIQRQSGFLTPIFEYKTNESATSIKNIEPAEFDITTLKLTKKGKLELI